MGATLTVQDLRTIRRCHRAARLNIRMAWAGALDTEAARQLVLAEEQLGIAERIAGVETDEVQPWEAVAAAA